MTKKFFSLIIIFSFLMVAGLVLAKDLNLPNGKTVDLPENFNSGMPEVEGTYTVPGHPELKLRVFVHYDKPPKPGKPKPEPQPANQVCDLQDPDSSVEVSAETWHLPNKPINYHLNVSNLPSTITGEDFDLIAVFSFAEWQEKTKISETSIEFINVNNTEITRGQFDGKNIVAFGRAPGNAIGITYIWYNINDHEVAEVDTILNQKFPWSWSDPGSWEEDQICAYEGSYDAQNILTHEIGHWVGLDDEYDGIYENHTMYGYGSKTETKKDTLTNGDVLGVSAIYY